MSTTLVLALVALLSIVLLALIIGAVWFWQRQAGEQGAVKKGRKTAKQPIEREKTKETVRPDDKAGQAPPPTPTTAIPSGPNATASPAPAVTARPAEDVAAGEKIRILIVDDNPGTRENVSRLLYFENDLEVIAQAVNGRQGIEMALKLKPHIVLMDINMPDMDGITAAEIMSNDAPYSQVIIMSVQADQHYMKQAMAAGARDFQPKPFTSAELINCIRRVYAIGLPIYQRIEAAEQAKTQITTKSPEPAGPDESSTPVIAVYSAKGGIGTSAISANLAVALQQEHGDVVLMDGDFQFGDIYVHLNTRPTRTISNLIHEGELDVELLPEVLLAHESGIKMLLAPPQPQLADAITPEMVTNVIRAFKHQFKVVVVDTSSQLTNKTLSVLDNADHILVITAPELPAIKSAKLFLGLAAQLEFAPERLGVVVNRAQLPGGVRIDQIEKVLKLERTYPIPYDPRMHMAINRGVAINQQDPRAPSAQAITHLAASVWQKLTEAMPVEEVEVA